MQTYDNGFQPVIWAGRRTLGRPALVMNPRLRPVRIHRRMFGGARDLVVTRQHCLLAADGVFLRAKDLPDRPGFAARIANGLRAVTYHHLLFERHEVIFSNGVPSESFYPGPQAVRSLTRSDRASLLRLMPALALGPEAYGPRARPLAEVNGWAEVLPPLHLAPGPCFA